MKPKIEINYLPKSNDPKRNCGGCSNFQPVPGSELDGRCFGNAITVEGLCNFHSPKAG